MKATDLAKCIFLKRTDDVVELEDEDRDEVAKYYPDYVALFSLASNGNHFIEHDAYMVEQISVDHNEGLITVFYIGAKSPYSFPITKELNLEVVKLIREEYALDSIPGAFGK